jgi:hypothetical protein
MDFGIYKWVAVRNEVTCYGARIFRQVAALHDDVTKMKISRFLDFSST